MRRIQAVLGCADTPMREERRGEERRGGERKINGNMRKREKIPK